MPNSGDDLTGSSRIQPLDVVPEAFVPLARKINELVAAANAANVGGQTPIKIVMGTAGKLVTLDMDALTKLLYKSPTNTAGTGGGGSGGRFLTITYCANGTPATANFLIQ
jgi:hypothetical protein